MCAQPRIAAISVRSFSNVSMGKSFAKWWVGSTPILQCTGRPAIFHPVTKATEKVARSDSHQDGRETPHLLPEGRGWLSLSEGDGGFIHRAAPSVRELAVLTRSLPI
jgi:hypothetical protein